MCCIKYRFRSIFSFFLMIFHSNNNLLIFVDFAFFVFYLKLNVRKYLLLSCHFYYIYINYFYFIRFNFALFSVYNLTILFQFHHFSLFCIITNFETYFFYSLFFFILNYKYNNIIYYIEFVSTFLLQSFIISCLVFHFSLFSIMYFFFASLLYF